MPPLAIKAREPLGDRQCEKNTKKREEGKGKRYFCKQSELVASR
jgi:hypothetical protein